MFILCVSERKELLSYILNIIYHLKSYIIVCYVTHCLKACWCSFINLTMTILVLEHIWTRG